MRNEFLDVLEWLIGGDIGIDIGKLIEDLREPDALLLSDRHGSR